MMLILKITILVGTIVHVWIPWHLNPIHNIWSDWATHWSHALHPIIDDPLGGNHPIFYQLWLSAVIKITNGEPGPIGVYASILSALTPWVWYRFFRELLPQKRDALRGWAALALLPSWIGMFSYFMIETLLLPLLGASLWFTWRCLRKKTVESLVWAVVLWLATALTKATAVPLAMISVYWLWSTQPDRWQRGLRIGLIIGVVLLPLCYRTYRLIGVVAPFGFQTYDQIYYESGNQNVSVRFTSHGKTWWTFNNASPSIYQRPFEPFTTWPLWRQGTCEIAIDLDHKKASWIQAFKNHKASFRDEVRHHVENVIYMLWCPSWPNESQTLFWDRASNVFRWLWSPLLLLSLGGNVWWFRKQREIALLPLLNTIGWILICVLPFGVGEGRYRKPFEGLLVANLLWLWYGRGAGPDVKSLCDFFPLALCRREVQKVRRALDRFRFAAAKRARE